MAIATAKPTARRAPSPAEQRFLKLTPRSRRAYEKTSPLIPGATPGGLDFSFPYPQFIKRAEGCYVWDADGRRLVDMMNGDWLLPLGHGNAKVVAAIAA
ncbi:MAG: aminotransferase class III-fold pyridoxal phosphate-dependent enzyme, partial [Chloroflexi bacterium]|nr:aminotransferase class III-fold pyridoxal phosphate-dependent enzyme [Chloroflexota bacterium]